MSDILVLNKGFLPIRTISDKEAICLLWQNKCYTVIESDKVMRSPSITIKVPNVIALTDYGEFPKRKISFSKLNVIYRDDMVCQYCGKQFNMNELTVDHIIPKSRWKEEKKTAKRDWSNWFNTVACCVWCNNKKGNSLLQEIDMKLLRQPFEPTYLPYIIVDYNKAKIKNWLPFCTYNVRLINTNK